LHKSTEPLCTLLVIVQLKKSQFGWPDGGADEFIDIALIFRIEEELPLLVKVFMVLLFELDDMLEHQFLLRCV